MTRLKRYFPIPYLILGLAVITHSMVHLTLTPGPNWAWVGALVAVAPLVLFMLSLAVVKRARTSRNIYFVLACATAGTALSLAFFESPATWYALGLGLIPSLVYVSWYSILDRSGSDAIRVGAHLPELDLRDARGNPVTQSDGKAGVYMFIRGNWCPLCMAQVHEVAAQYRVLEARGAEVFLISPQPERQTQKLSKRFDAPIRFCVDKDKRIAKRLGIEHIGGVPFGIPGGYATDSVLPTVVITDRNRKIIFADMTDNYRVRPEVSTFLEALTPPTNPAKKGTVPFFGPTLPKPN